MAVLTSQLIVKLIDGVTGPATRAGAAINRLVAAGNRAAFVTPLQRMGQNLRQVGAQAQNLSQTVSGPLALVAALGGRAAFEFEKAGNLMEALGDATRQQRADFERYANELNSEFPQSLAEIIRTANEMLKAGFNFDQMRGAIRQTLATAILGEMKPSDVAAMMSASINAFQMPMENYQQAMRSSQQISDRMTYAAVKTTASLRDMGEMFRYVAAAAAASGSDLDTTTAFAMAFARNKIVGSEAGVALRSAIVRLVRMPRPGLAAMERIGMNLGDYQRGARPITTDNIMSGLTAGGIDASPIRAQIDALLADPSLRNAPVRLAAKVTDALQQHLQSTGSALDAQTIATNVQESIVAAGNKIDLMKFFEDLRQKMAAGTATLGDVAAILEGRHFARYQALLQSNIAQIREGIQRESDGYTMSRYVIANQGIVGAVRDFTAALEGLAVALGRSVFVEAAAGLRQVSAAVNSFSESNPQLMRFIVYAGAAIIALAPLGLIATGVAAAVKMMAAALGAVLLVLTPVGAGVMVLVGALAGLAAFVYSNWAGVSAMFSEFFSTLAKEFPATTAFVQALWEGLKNVTSAFGAMTGATGMTIEQWRELGRNAALLASIIVESVGVIVTETAKLGAAIVSGLVTKTHEVVEYFRTIPQRAATAVGEGATALYQAGVNLIQSLINGMMAKVEELMTYIRGLGSRISGAFGSIRIPGFGGGAASSGGTSGARASGGPVSAGHSYIVGERGRELFTPGQNGWINPNGGSGRGGGGAGGGASPSVTLAPVMHFHGPDAAAVAREARQQLEDYANSKLRQLFADYGVAAT